MLPLPICRILHDAGLRVFPNPEISLQSSSHLGSSSEPRLVQDTSAVWYRPEQAPFTCGRLGFLLMASCTPCAQVTGAYSISGRDLRALFARLRKDDSSCVWPSSRSATFAVLAMLLEHALHADL